LPLYGVEINALVGQARVHFHRHAYHCGSYGGPTAS
jgi:hypothetical protein